MSAQHVHIWVTRYAWFLVAFTALMVGMSLIAPQPFFENYHVSADAAFQTSWSLRYLAILIVMVVALLMKKPETLLLAVLARFAVDVFDGISVMLYNTPPFSFGWLIFHLCVLIIPEIVTLRSLIRRSKNV